MEEKKTFKKFKYEFDCLKTIQEFMPVKKMGANYACNCPFHGETNASLVINTKDNLWHCFGCGMGGDAIQFYAKYNRIDYKKAYIELCEKNGLTPEIQLQKNPNQKLFDLNKQVETAYNMVLNRTLAGDKALEYLKKRHVSVKTIQEFNLGCTTLSKNGTPDGIKNIALGLGYTEEEMQKVGILNSKGNDIFTERIVFPVKDETGNTLGFVGRTTNDNLVKYLNTPDTIIYKKGDNLFNLDKATKNSTGSSASELILCEGPFDVLALYEAGLKNAVCSLGCNLADGQIKKLKKFAKKVTIIYDSDKSGITASIKTYLKLKSEGINTNLVYLKGAKDASEYVEKFGLEALKNFVSNSKGTLYDYLLTYFVQKPRSIKFVEAFQKKFFELLANESAIIQKDSLTKYSKILNISFEKINKEFIGYFGSLQRVLCSIYYYYINDKAAFMTSKDFIQKPLLSKEDKNFLNALHIYYKKYSKFSWVEFNKETKNAFVEKLKFIPKTPIASLKELYRKQFDIFLNSKLN